VGDLQRSLGSALGGRTALPILPTAAQWGPCGNEDEGFRAR
jgi:hypothetical protein